MPTNMADQVWRTGSIFSCCKELWDVFLPKPITTKHQSVFWLVSQSRRMSAICVGSCRWISLAAATADPVVTAQHRRISRELYVTRCQRICAICRLRALRCGTIARSRNHRQIAQQINDARRYHICT